MSVPAYERYRDSGVEWIGDVPDEWSIIPLKAAYSVVGGATPKSEVADYWDGGVPWVTPSDLSKLDTPFIGETLRTISEAGLAACAATRVPAGSVILSTRAPIGSLGITTEPATTNQGCKALVPRRGSVSQFLAYTLSVATTALNVRGKGTTFLELSGDELSRFKIPSPSPPEQSAIAAFLDRETGKIDTLIEAQQRLIGLLKEKRQAAISHAVTKGIDPSVPMKDAGVEWLGAVPAHWSVRPLKAVAHIQTGVAKGKDNGSREAVQVPYLRVANVQDGWIDLSDVATIELPTSDVGRYQLRAGDVLMNEGGDFDKLGRGGIWHGQIDPCVHQNHVFSVRPFSVSPEWLSLTTGSVGAQFFFKGRSKQSTNLASISSTNLMELPILVPPRKEQQEIVDYLTGLIDGSDDLIDEAGKAIAFLQERRSALISAAVTGKIDVRQQAEAPSAIDQPTARRLVGAAVLELVADNPGSGRMTSAKRMYLAEAHAGVWELRGQPQRKAAGPFDSALMSEIEIELARVGHIATSQPGGPGSQVHYNLTGARGALRAELDAMLGDRRAVFDRMLVDLSTLESKGIEAVATLFAVWNDMLIDGQTPTDNTVIDGVLNDWHEEKRDKFTRPDLNSYLGWMRRHDMTPSGRGPRTKMGALL